MSLLPHTERHVDPQDTVLRSEPPTEAPQHRRPPSQSSSRSRTASLTPTSQTRKRAPARIEIVHRSEFAPKLDVVNLKDLGLVGSTFKPPPTDEELRLRSARERKTVPRKNATDRVASPPVKRIPTSEECVPLNYFSSFKVKTASSGSAWARSQTKRAFPHRNPDCERGIEVRLVRDLPPPAARSNLKAQQEELAIRLSRPKGTVCSEEKQKQHCEAAGGGESPKPQEPSAQSIQWVEDGKAAPQSQVQMDATNTSVTFVAEEGSVQR